MSLLSVRDLHITYNTQAGPVPAVRGVTLEIDKGEVLGLAGESGCGKSTIAAAILRLLPPRTKVEGRILLEGEDVLEMKPKRLRAVRWTGASIIFQGAMHALNPVRRVGDQIAEAITTHQYASEREAMVRVGALLEQVGLPPRRLQEYPHELSGGQRQRVMIAMALACGPNLIIADEPTTALDVTVQRQILDLLVGIRDRHATAVVLISHDLGIVQGRTDRVAVMYAGRVTEAGPTEAVFAAPRHRYTAALLATTPRLTGPLPERMPVIAGTLPDPTDPPPGCRFAPRCPAVQADCAEEDQGLLVGSVHTQACRHPVPVGAQGRQ